MVNSNANAIGIIFPNSYDNLVPELAGDRLMASIPFASRYRLIDFTLSSMVTNGISNVAVVVSNNYQSLIDHLGSGRSWDLVRKNGGLNIFPPNAYSSSKPYVGRAGALANILDFLKKQKQKYVLLANANIASNFDFRAMVDAHVASGADVTLAYREQELPKGFVEAPDDAKGYYYTLRMDEDKRINKLYVNPKDKGIQNFYLNIMVISRELLIDLVNEASLLGKEYLERDVLLPKLSKLNVRGYKYDGYTACITGLKSYFDENLKLIDEKNLNALFPKQSPVYTKIRDDNPVRYVTGSRVESSILADGCIIEGTVENSVLFRGVRVKKGAVVKNCVLMQDTVIEPNAELDCVVTDKNVKITAGKKLSGTESFPVYVQKNHIV